jgi:hypothetical protein
LNKPEGDIIYGFSYSVSKQYSPLQQKIFRIWYSPDVLFTNSIFINNISLSVTTLFSIFLLSYNSFIKFLFFKELAFLARPLMSAPSLGFTHKKNCCIENPDKFYPFRAWPSYVFLRLPSGEKTRKLRLLLVAPSLFSLLLSLTKMSSEEEPKKVVYSTSRLLKLSRGMIYFNFDVTRGILKKKMPF